MKKLFIVSFSIFMVSTMTAQKEITLENIWKTGTFRINNVFGLVSMNDGIHYTTIKNDTIFRFSYEKETTPEIIVSKSQLLLNGTAINIDNYQFSPDENKMLIASGTEQIYRHSTRENYYVYDRTAKTLIPVTKGEKQMHATFSPDGSKVGFVRGNNIFIKDLATGKETQVTTDGSQNNIINGATD